MKNDNILERIRERAAAIDDIEAEVHSLENGVLTVCPTGHCSGCYNAAVEIKEALQKALGGDFPEVEEIRVEHIYSKETLDFVRELLSGGKK